MKRKVLALLLCLVLFVSSLAPSALAVNNAILGSPSQPVPAPASSSGRPGLSDIQATDNADKVSYPSADSYFSNYVVYYINASKGHSTYAYYMPSTGADHPRTVYHGSRVIGIAAQSGMTCVLYYMRDREYRTGWVKSSELSTTFPGKTLTIDNSFGRISAQNLWYEGDPDFSVSRDFFVGSQENYMLLDWPIYNVSRFTVDYHVVNKGSSNGWQGTRTVYINDGSGWMAVGSFDYSKDEVIHAEITLSEPATVAAVAVIANSLKPGDMSTRFAVLDVYTS